MSGSVSNYGIPTPTPHFPGGKWSHSSAGTVTLADEETDLLPEMAAHRRTFPATLGVWASVEKVLGTTPAQWHQTMVY